MVAHCTDEETEARARSGAAGLAGRRPPHQTFLFGILLIRHPLLYSASHTHICIPVLLEPTRPSPGLRRPLDSHNQLLQVGLLTLLPAPSIFQKGKTKAESAFLAQGRVAGQSHTSAERVQVPSSGELQALRHLCFGGPSSHHSKPLRRATSHAPHRAFLLHHFKGFKKIILILLLLGYKALIYNGCDFLGLIGQTGKFLQSEKI